MQLDIPRPINYFTHQLRLLHVTTCNYAYTLLSSVPAPLFYNEDSTPDLLVRVNRGVWNTYNYSYIAILDGQTGDTLWRLYSTQTGMMSVLSLAANQAGADGAVFISIGYMKEDDPAINAVPIHDCANNYTHNHAFKFGGF